MAVSLGNGRAGPRSRGRLRSYAPMSEINVTPLVDVMLVLLIVFMITAPLLTVGVPVDLPKTQANNLSDQDEPLVVTVDAEGRMFLQETEIEPAALVPRLRAITDNKPDSRIYVRGDRKIAYGRVMEVMGLVNAAGFTRVALVAELPNATDVPNGRRQGAP
ncbi:MAG: protein TolR [Acetobacterales bacterium]